MPKTSVECPSCHTSLGPSADHCFACGQEFCPVCQAPLAPSDTRCDACGTAFNLLCPRCDSELEADADFCAACGLAFTEEAETEAAEVGAALLDEETRVCPSCSELIYLPDGFCRECGQELCPGCGELIAEEDDVCGNCGLILYFPCPLCYFELMAGTEICPNCQALFPNFCATCGEPVELADRNCVNCGIPVSREPRPGVRVVQVVVVKERRTPILACPHCDEHFSPVVSDCPRCGTRICPRCQVTLQEADTVCPRCGLSPEVVRESATNSIESSEDGDTQASAGCPACGMYVARGSDECPHCLQVLCPQCLTAVDEADVVCPQCGVEFEFACPTCDTLVGPDEDHCPQCGLAF